MRPQVSAVFYAFHGNHTEVDNLFRIHKKITGGRKGQGRNLTPSLLRSSIVFMCASWETFVEDICMTGAKVLVDSTDDASKLPNGIKAAIANELKDAKNPLSLWAISGRGWKNTVEEKVGRMCDGAAGGLNTPNYKNISKLMDCIFHIKDLKDDWKWQGMTAEGAVRKLNDIIKLRGSIAHGQHNGPLNIQTCRTYNNHIEKLVELTAQAVDRQINKLLA